MGLKNPEDRFGEFAKEFSVYMTGILNRVIPLTYELHPQSKKLCLT